MNMPIAIKIECAKGEMMNAMQRIQDKYALPPCIVDGIISAVLAEVRAEAKLELINATNAMMREKDAEREMPEVKEGGDESGVDAKEICEN